MAVLTDKQKLFAQEYLVDLNATQAAIRAGYSEKTANEQGARLLANVSIQELIQKGMAERSKRTQITADRVLEEYAKIGFSNITDYLKVTVRERLVKIEHNGETHLEKEMMQGVDLFDTDEVDRDKMAAVAEIKQTKEGIALKLHDKKGALDSIAKHLGMFADTSVNININNLSDEEIDKILSDAS